MCFDLDSIPLLYAGSQKIRHSFLTFHVGYVCIWDTLGVRAPPVSASVDNTVG